MAEIVDLALRTVIDSFEILPLILCKKKIPRLTSLCPNLYLG